MPVCQPFTEMRAGMGIAPVPIAMADARATCAGLKVEVPDDGYHRGLISCPVHTDARGYVRAIAAGRFEEAYLIARGPNPFA